MSNTRDSQKHVTSCRILQCTFSYSSCYFRQQPISQFPRSAYAQCWIIVNTTRILIKRSLSMLVNVLRVKLQSFAANLAKMQQDFKEPATTLMAKRCGISLISATEFQLFDHPLLDQFRASRFPIRGDLRAKTTVSCLTVEVRYFLLCGRNKYTVQVG